MHTAVNGSYRSLFVALLIACAPAVRTPGPSAPVPATPEQKAEQPSATLSWSFSYLAGVTSYRVIREAVIQNQPDSGSVRTGTASNVTHESLTLERIGDTIHFAIAADTFATTTKDSTVPVETPILPVRLAGNWVNNGLMIPTDTVTAGCNPVESVLASDLHNLLVTFPAPLTRGMAWSDSVRLSGCQGTIPTVANISRVYTVSGDTIFDGSPVVIVERRDTIQAEGEGAQQQHQLHLRAVGSGTALYYLDPGTGRVAQLITTHEIGVTITASGKSHHFRQSLKQEFVLAH